jgi:hypothetical protein
MKSAPMVLLIIAAVIVALIVLGLGSDLAERRPRKG